MKSIEIPQPEDRSWRYRIWEILPAIISYSVLLLPIILGAISPKVAAYFIIAYLLLWFVRAIGLNVRSLQGYHNLEQQKKLPWGELNRDLEELTVHTANPPKWHPQNLKRVTENMMSTRIKPSQVYHAAVVAFYNETKDVLEPTIKSVLDSEYDPKKIILILAYEERAGPEKAKLAKELIKEYGPRFYYAEAVGHPDGLPNEVRGKGGNITFAGRRLQKVLEDKKIDPLHVIVTTLDSDNRPDKNYLAALTYTYCSTEDPLHASYQPIPMFLNNIWDAPAPMRVIATGNSFWNVVLSLRPHMLRNFSSHAQPMAALIDTDFWSTRTIVEDGHQYWRTFFRYDGNHEVYPIFLPIYQDAVLAETYKKTLKVQFKQVQRWSWGASDIAYVYQKGFREKNKIPKLKMLARFGRLLEGHISWATAPLILLIAAYIPFVLNTDNYLANQLPQVASKLQQVAMVGILVSLFLCVRTLPPKPERYKRRRTLWMMVQWVYLPLTSIIFSAFAALNSQTRLMLGKYLGFNVTEKATKSERLRVTNY
jgi:cellulose synthase/poly-beta-1,6-N-acetylglucosamine synthase-like glycosyltransferase